MKRKISKTTVVTIILVCIQVISRTNVYLYALVHLMDLQISVGFGLHRVFLSGGPVFCIPLSFFSIFYGGYAIYREIKNGKRSKKLLIWYWIFTIGSAVMLILNTLYMNVLFRQ